MDKQSCLESCWLLQDAFASAALLWDKPFVTGDVVKVAGSQSGVVETIGLKTTHVRNFDGALLVLPNRELCNRVVENYSRQPFRRHRFHLTLSPSTDPAALELLEGDLMAALGALNPDR